MFERERERERHSRRSRGPVSGEVDTDPSLLNCLYHYVAVRYPLMSARFTQAIYQQLLPLLILVARQLLLRKVNTGGTHHLDIFGVPHQSIAWHTVWVFFFRCERHQHADLRNLLFPLKDPLPLTSKVPILLHLLLWNTDEHTTLCVCLCLWVYVCGFGVGVFMCVYEVLVSVYEV